MLLRRRKYESRRGFTLVEAAVVLPWWSWSLFWLSWPF